MKPNSAVKPVCVIVGQLRTSSTITLADEIMLLGSQFHFAKSTTRNFIVSWKARELTFATHPIS